MPNHQSPSFADPGTRGQVVVLLPTLDEEGSVGRVIDRIPRAEIERRGYDVAVWVIDGHSSDTTRDVAMHKGASIYVQRSGGKGSAMQQALKYLVGSAHGAGGRTSSGRGFFFMLDSDGTYPPESLPNLLDPLEAGYDVVLGSRFLGHIEEGAIPPVNRIGNHLLNALASALYGARVSDVCTGMWGFTERFIGRLAIVAQGFDLEADLFASAHHMGARFIERPIEYHRRTGEPKMAPLRTGLLIARRLVQGRFISNVTGALHDETSDALGPGEPVSEGNRA